MEEKGSVFMIEEINSVELKKCMDTDEMMVVDCYAPWCRFCTMLEPILDEISIEFEESIYFYKINTDENVDFSKEYEIMSLPTILVIKNGKVLNRKSGLVSAEDLRSMLNGQ